MVFKKAGLSRPMQLFWESGMEAVREMLIVGLSWARDSSAVEDPFFSLMLLMGQVVKASYFLEAMRSTTLLL